MSPSKHAKAADLRVLSPKEIVSRVEDRKKELFDMRFAAEAGRLEKPHTVRAAKKEIARLLTVLREKEAASGPEGTK